MDYVAPGTYDLSIGADGELARHHEPRRVSKRFFELERLAIVRVVLCVGKREALLTPLRGVPDNWDRHAYLVLCGRFAFIL